MDLGAAATLEGQENHRAKRIESNREQDTHTRPEEAAVAEHYRGNVVEEETLRPSEMADKRPESGMRNMCELNSSDSDSSGGTASHLQVITEAEDEFSSQSAGTQSPAGRTDSTSTGAVAQAGGDKSKIPEEEQDDRDRKLQGELEREVNEQTQSEGEEADRDEEERAQSQVSAQAQAVKHEEETRNIEKKQFESKEEEGFTTEATDSVDKSSKPPLGLGFAPASPSSPSFRPWAKTAKGPVTSFSTRTPPATSNVTRSSRLIDAAMGAMANMSNPGASSTSKPPLSGGGRASGGGDASVSRNPLASFLSSRNDPIRCAASDVAQQEDVDATEKSGESDAQDKAQMSESKASRNSPFFLTHHRPEISSSESTARTVEQWKERERKSLDAGRSPGISPRTPGMSPRANVGVSSKGAMGVVSGGNLFKRRVVPELETAGDKGLTGELASSKTSGQDQLRQESDKEQARKQRFQQAQAGLEESKAALSRLSFETQDSETGMVDDLASAFLQGLGGAELGTEDAPSTDSKSSAASAASSPAVTAVALLRCDLPRKVAQNESQERSPGKGQNSPDLSPLKSRQRESPGKTRKRSPDARYKSPAKASRSPIRLKSPAAASAPVDQALLAGAAFCFDPFRL